MPGPSVSFDGREPIETVLAKADAAVPAGVGSIWLACHLFQRDPITTASVLLGRHPELKIVLVALSPYVMHPIHAAMAAATLDEYFPGRISLCLGVGAPADLASVGVDGTASLATMREALEICHSLFTGELVRIDGQRFQVTDRTLGSGRHGVPILLAASGPKMLPLAGSHADGVLLSAGASAEFVSWSLDQVSTGEPDSGFRRSGLIYAAVDTDVQVARDRVRSVLATVLRGKHHARNLTLAGTQLDQDALAASDPSTAPSLIDDTVVDRHAAAGNPDLFQRRIADYRAAGLDDTILASIRTPEQIIAVVSALKSTD